MNQETNRKNEVLELQNMLRLISQADGSLPLVNPDGIFGPETEAAVIAAGGHDQGRSKFRTCSAGKANQQLQHLTDIFLACSRYELAFWDMAWTRKA